MPGRRYYPLTFILYFPLSHLDNTIMASTISGTSHSDNQPLRKALSRLSGDSRFAKWRESPEPGVCPAPNGACSKATRQADETEMRKAYCTNAYWFATAGKAYVKKKGWSKRGVMEQRVLDAMNEAETALETAIPDAFERDTVKNALTQRAVTSMDEYLGAPERTILYWNPLCESWTLVKEQFPSQDDLNRCVS